jgi:hypothetical protein
MNGILRSTCRHCAEPIERGQGRWSSDRHGDVCYVSPLSQRLHQPAACAHCGRAVVLDDGRRYWVDLGDGLSHCTPYQAHTR